MHGDSRTGEVSVELDAHAIVLVVFFDLCPFNGFDVEDDSILALDCTDLPYHGFYIFDFRRSPAKQVEVFGGTMSLPRPQREKSCALERKAVPVRRVSKAIEKALDSVSAEYSLIVFSAHLSQTQQASAYGGCEIRAGFRTHSDSRYDRITLLTRQIAA